MPQEILYGGPRKQRIRQTWAEDDVFELRRMYCYLSRSRVCSAIKRQYRRRLRRMSEDLPQ